MKLILIISSCIFIVLILIKLFLTFKIDFVKIISVRNTETNEQFEIPLKPCPFCGANKADIVIDEVEEDHTKITVYALSCSDKHGGCGCSTAFFTEPIEAIDAWNLRAND